MRTLKTALALAACAGLWARAESNFPLLGTDTTRSTIPLEQVLSAGPPPQGVPALGFGGDRTGRFAATPAPAFVPLERSSWLDAQEPLIVHGGKGYPLRLLLWHEVVNDRAGVPVAVAFSPPSHSFAVFDRRVPLTPEQRDAVLRLDPAARVLPLDDDFRARYREQTGREAPPWGLEVTFGTSGMLYNANLLMFDSASGSVFSQFLHAGVVGTLASAELLRLPAQVVSAAEFARAYPQGQVLSLETGYPRPYAQNPYLGYERLETPGFVGRVLEDRRLPARERVLGLEVGGEAVAYAFSSLARRRAVNDRVGGVDVAVWWAPGTRSVLDAATVAQAKDAGAVGVFRRTLEGRTLSFEWDGQGWTDRESGSRWNLLGQAVEGPLKGKRLTPLPHDVPFWFAWTAFRPEAQLR